jgi:hypothetical protein
MKNLLYLSLLVILTACNAKPPQQSKHSNPDKSTAVARTYSGTFDLAKLLLNENLPALMAALHVKPEPKNTDESTMLKFETFKSSSSKVLRFENVDFSGSNGKNKNQVFFHYNEKNNMLACYELKIYNQEQTDKLIGLLGKVGKLNFKQTKLPKGSIAIDVNGDEIKPEKLERKTYRVWENKITGITYFLSETGSGQNLITELIVLKRATQFGKDWISFLQLDWYRYEKSEPL